MVRHRTPWEDLASTRGPVHYRRRSTQAKQDPFWISQSAFKKQLRPASRTAHSLRRCLIKLHLLRVSLISFTARQQPHRAQVCPHRPGPPSRQTPQRNPPLRRRRVSIVLRYWIRPVNTRSQVILPRPVRYSSQANWRTRRNLLSLRWPMPRGGRVQPQYPATVGGLDSRLIVQGRVERVKEPTAVFGAKSTPVSRSVMGRK